MVCLVMVSSIKTHKVLAIVILSEVTFLLIFSYDFSLVIVFIVTVGSNIIFSVHNKVMPKPHLGFTWPPKQSLNRKSKFKAHGFYELDFYIGNRYISWSLENSFYFLWRPTYNPLCVAGMQIQ